MTGKSVHAKEAARPAGARAGLERGASFGVVRGRAGRVRPFVAEDGPRVAGLHREVFGIVAGRNSDRSYAAYFREMFLNNPWYDGARPSLVYEDADGAIIGFLGVMPRRLSIRGRSIQAAVSSQFVVEPGRRSSLAAVELLKAFLSGPQDLSIADEATDASRRLWECLGGTTALLYSLYWARVLRPSEFFVSQLRKRGGLAPLAAVSGPACRLIDGIAARLGGSPFYQRTPRVIGAEMDAEMLLAGLVKFAPDWPLRPEYDLRSLEWLLERLVRGRSHGPLEKVVVRSETNGTAGWYLYVPTPSRIGEVLQLVADAHSMGDVLDHLFHHAWRQGMLALAGRIEPRFLSELRERSCVFHHRGQWVLVHSRDPEILGAIHRGDAFLTRLEGEWCMRYEPDAW